MLRGFDAEEEAERAKSFQSWKNVTFVGFMRHVLLNIQIKYHLQTPQGVNKSISLLVMLRYFFRYGCFCC